MIILPILKLLSRKIEKSMTVQNSILFEILCYFEINGLVNALHILHFVSHFRLLYSNAAVSYAEHATIFEPPLILFPKWTRAV